MFEKVRDIIVDTLSCEMEDVTMEADLAEDLGADSLDAIDIVMSVEDEFGLEVPDEVVESMSTVSDIVKFIEDNK